MPEAREGEIIPYYVHFDDPNRQVLLGYLRRTKGVWVGVTKAAYEKQERQRAEEESNMARSRIIIEFSHPKGVMPNVMENIQKRATDAATVVAAKEFKMTKDQIKPDSAITQL